MKKTILGLFLFIVCPVTVLSQVFFDTISLRTHLNLLASDSLEGRNTGTIGGKRAAHYIRQEFEKAGLTLIGENGLQPFTYKYWREIGTYAVLKVNGNSFKQGIDFVHFINTPDVHSKGKVVFVGYGLSDSIQDDYKQFNIRGKWLLMFRGVPQSYQTKGIFVTLRSKLEWALERGVKGVLLMDPSIENPMDTLVQENMNSLYAALPVVQISQKIADAILLGSGVSVASFIETDTQGESSTAKELRASFSYRSDIIPTPIQGSNVIGLLKGTDTKLQSEYIIVGAHFDHLGAHFNIKNSTQRIFYGADDNASGIAVLLELAKELVKSKKFIQRSILFVAFDGEEKGMVGSSYFIKNLPPGIKKSKIKSMINLDMIGRYNQQEGLIVSGTGSFKEGDDLFNWMEKHSTLSLSKNDVLFEASDQIIFFRKKIPVLFMTTGIHPDYHTSKDVKEKIHYTKMAEIADLTYLLIQKLAVQKQALLFQSK